MPTKFPNLFLIGAMKAGTSSLHEYLHQHPQIFMSRFKEPQYFAPHTTRLGFKWGQGNPYPEPGIDWYLRLFEDAGDVKYAGESSVSYTARPVISGCERHIYNFNPDARLIYLLRDPIQRTISHYWHYVAGGLEDRSMLSAVKRREEYIARSHYAMQLKPYLDYFGKDQIFVLTIEELNANPPAAFRRIFEWLQIDVAAEIDVEERHNVGSDEFRQTRRGLVPVDTVLNNWRWKRAENRLPAVVPRLIRGLIYREIRRDRVDVGPTIHLLRPILQEYTAELAELLGRDFPEWKTLYPTPVDEPTSIGTGNLLTASTREALVAGGRSTGGI